MHFNIIQDKNFFCHVNFVRLGALDDSQSRTVALENTQWYDELLKNRVTYFTIVRNRTFGSVHFNFWYVFSLCWQVSRTEKITEIGRKSMCLTCTTSYFQTVDNISVPTKRPEGKFHREPKCQFTNVYFGREGKKKKKKKNFFFFN